MLLLLAFLVPESALAQKNALIVQDLDPMGYDSLQQELANQGITYDVVGTSGPTNLSNVVLMDYHMVFVSECQSDALYTGFNDNFGRFDSFVDSGGFLAIHASYCGAMGSTVVDFPGGRIGPLLVGSVNQAFNQAPGSLLMTGIMPIFSGTPVAYDLLDGFDTIGGDIILILDDQFLHPVWVERFYGSGAAVIGTWMGSYGYDQGEAAGDLLINEVQYGATFGCPDVDGDGTCNPEDPCPLDNPNDTDIDGVCDSDDVCPGGNDNIDSDGDGVPNACDVCPGGHDILDTDGDGVVDGCDACPLDNPDDTDGDDVCDSDDLCPYADDGLDADLDLVPDGCDVCPGADDLLNADGDALPDGCDPCPTFPDEEDEDGDGFWTCDDCDDTVPTIYWGASETVADGIDQDCDGQDTCYVDQDHDGFGGSNTVGGVDLDCTNDLGASDNDDDCDDLDPSVNPNAAEIDFDNVDQNCDGDVGLASDLDSDGDGLPDAIEQSIGSDASSDDSDGDGVMDLTEFGDTSVPRDSDGDGLFDIIDPDDDGDGLDTEMEGTEDFDGDGIPNYLDLDSDGDGAADASENPATFLDDGSDGVDGEAPPSRPDAFGCGCNGGAGAPRGVGFAWGLLGVVLE